MSEIVKIIKKNRATVYNYSTGLREPVWPGHVVTSTIAFLFSYFASKLDAQFLGAVLTVFGILIGFSFNVLIYLLSFGKKTEDNNHGDHGNLEQQARRIKLNTLAEELFWNVSYFNIVAIAVVVVTMMSFISYGRISVYLADTLPLVGRFVMFWLLTESLRSFIRAVNRITFYFSLKKVTA